MNGRMDETRHFRLPGDAPESAEEIIEVVYQALKAKGHDPIMQLVGYLISGDPTYITSYNNARALIRRLERDELLEEFIRFYVVEHDQEIMRVVCLDVGERRIGVAVTDALDLTAQGVETIWCAGLEHDLARVREICAQYATNRLLLGLPRNMDGSEGFQAQRVRRFAEKLAVGGFEIRFQDERMTTKQATGVLLEADMRRRQAQKRRGYARGDLHSPVLHGRGRMERQAKKETFPWREIYYVRSGKHGSGKSR